MNTYKIYTLDNNNNRTYLGSIEAKSRQNAIRLVNEEFMLKCEFIVE